MAAESSVNREGREEEAVPMYSIQADQDVPELDLPISAKEDIESYFPYKLHKTKVNPCGEGLEDPVLLQEDDDINEGVDNDNNEAANRRRRDGPETPGCCRRYSCCFPLIVIVLIWLMMISAEAFEHCQDCTSTKHDYSCSIETKADYYCKANKLQICCSYEGDECKLMDYPSELSYSMGEYFALSMSIVIIICLLPCLLPCGIPIMLYNDCRNKKYSPKRQIYFDILCTICFVTAALSASWTTYEYYRYPQNRCSENSDLFGISTSDNDSNSLHGDNIWIMSQTTYCSFFCFILLCSFSVCGSTTLILQLIAKRKKNAAKIAQPDKEENYRS